MKLLIDHQIFTWRKEGGIPRMFYGLIENFSIDAQIEITVPLKYSDNENLKKIKGFSNDIEKEFDPFKDFLFGLSFKGKGRLFNIYQKIFGIQKRPEDYNRDRVIEELKKQDFDIFIPSYYDDYFLDYLNGKPFVLVVHDMIQEIYPEYNLLETVSNKKRRLIDRASIIIANSENTKKDIVRFCNIDPSKIVVAYPSCSIPSSHEAKPSFLPDKYYLFIGNRSRYKNFYFLVMQFSKVLKKIKDVNLVVIGSPFYDDEVFFMKKEGVYDKVVQLDVTDQQLPMVYSNSIGLLFVSNYEGFGLPTIEAFANSCPVIISNKSCMPEVGGDAAYYVDPKDPKEIMDAMEKLYFDKNLRLEMIDKGHEHLKSFGFGWVEFSNKFKKALLQIN